MDRNSIHVTSWGTSGPRVVMVHGGAQGSRAAGEANFSRQQPLATEGGWRLIVPDRPGHGLSPDPGRPDDSDLDGEWVAELLGDEAHLVGHSFGACVALAAAAKRPSAVRSLTLIEPGLQKFAISDPHVKRLALGLVMAKFLSISNAQRTGRIVKLLGIPPEVSDRSTPEEQKRMGKSVMRSRFPSRETASRELAVVRTSGIPLLVISGGWSPAFEATSNMVAAAGGGQRAVIEAGHHFPQFLADKFNPVLDAFMKESDALRTASMSQRAATEVD